MSNILVGLQRLVLKKEVKKKSTKKKSKKQTKKTSEERKIRREISIVKSISRVIKREDEKDKKKKESETDSLDSKISSENPFEEKKEDRVADNSYGRRGINLSVYSPSISSSYTDYDKIWNHLGEFRTRGMYQFSEFEEKRLKETPLVIPSTPQILCDFKVIETCVKHQKYFMPGDNMNGSYGNVPMAGINSKDWEKFQLWAQVDYVMYKLFMDTM